MTPHLTTLPVSAFQCSSSDVGIEHATLNVADADGIEDSLFGERFLRQVPLIAQAAAFAPKGYENRVTFLHTME